MQLKPSETMRIDKWLWAARFFKTRMEAQRLIASGRLRLDGARMSKPHRQVGTGHVLTFPKSKNIRVIKISALAAKRGPAVEAATLYEDLAPPQPRIKSGAPKAVPFEQREQGSGRPTKRNRRQTDRLKF
jgi:ribosome-associated heat shock protein Hsp15